MLGIAEFFKRIQGATAKEIFVRSVIKDAIKKHTGIEIPIEAISFSGTSVVLKNVNQTARSVIFTKQPAILRDIESNQDMRKISGIR